MLDIVLAFLLLDGIVENETLSGEELGQLSNVVDLLQ